MQQQNHFMQKSHKTSHCAQYTHKKHETYTIIVRCCFFSQQNNIYKSQHQYICYRKHSFKIRPNSQRKTHRGCKLSIPFWQEGLSCKLWKCAQYTHKTYKTKQHWKTANMHHNINMFTTGNTHLKYTKHPVHSAAHKLKIRSSQLVLTTAGTDLDSTDRAAIRGAKNSSASEPLKRPILSLWNSHAHKTLLVHPARVNCPWKTRLNLVFIFVSFCHSPCAHPLLFFVIFIVGVGVGRGVYWKYDQITPGQPPPPPPPHTRESGCFYRGFFPP